MAVCRPCRVPPTALRWDSVRPGLAADPFQTSDRDGVGLLIRMSVEKGRAARPDLKIGICGEQG
ncbi:MAG: hypothetical protein V1742_06485, partial [Pseudomonadota bacterium]